MTLPSEAAAAQALRSVAAVILSDRLDPQGAGRGPHHHRAARRDAHPAVVGRPARRPLLPRLPQPHDAVHRPEGGAGGSHRAGRGRRGRRVHPSPRRVRARLDARTGRAPRRSRRPAGGEGLALDTPVPTPSGWTDDGRPRRPATSCSTSAVDRPASSPRPRRCSTGRVEGRVLRRDHGRLRRRAING